MAIDSPAASLAQCVQASAYCVEAMAAFQTACAEGNWAVAEIERAKVIAATETYLDLLMSMHRAFLGGP